MLQLLAVILSISRHESEEPDPFFKRQDLSDTLCTSDTGNKPEETRVAPFPPRGTGAIDRTYVTGGTSAAFCPTTARCVRKLRAFHGDFRVQPSAESVPLKILVKRDIAISPAAIDGPSSTYRCAKCHAFYGEISPPNRVRRSHMLIPLACRDERERFRLRGCFTGTRKRLGTVVAMMPDSEP